MEAPKLPSLPISETGSPEEAAIKLRKLWKLPKGAIENLTEVLEQNGIITVPVDFKTDRIDSRSILIDNKYPVIFYNKSLLGDRLRFSLSYELGHLVMHTRQLFLSTEDVGHEANIFAAEFLMPEKDIKGEFKEGITLDILAQLKKQWKVSKEVKRQN